MTITFIVYKPWQVSVKVSRCLKGYFGLIRMKKLYTLLAFFRAFFIRVWRPMVAHEIVLRASVGSFIVKSYHGDSIEIYCERLTLRALAFGRSSRGRKTTYRVYSRCSANASDDLKMVCKMELIYPVDERGFDKPKDLLDTLTAHYLEIIHYRLFKLKN